MKKKSHLLPTATSAIALTCALALPSISQAATFNYVGGNGSATNWNQASWEPDGGGAAVAPTAGNTYVVATNSAIRTETSASTFAGGFLELQGANTKLGLKADATVNLIMGDGTAITNFTGGDQVNGTITTVGSGSIAMVSARSDTITLNSEMTIGTGMSSITVQYGTGTGNGTLAVTNGSNTFAGTWDVTEGLLWGTTAGSLGASSFNLSNIASLDFDYDFSNTAGDLTIVASGTLTLDQALTFGSATIGGTSLTAGDYDAADLAGLGITATGGGILTVVPEPGSYALLAGICGLTFVMLRRRNA